MFHYSNIPIGAKPLRSKGIMRVIFHGDDFGLTSGINKSIHNCFQHGLLTSTSLLVCGEAAEEAIALAKENPDLDVGIHLALCDESPVLPPEHLPSIIPKGFTFPTREQILRAVLSRKINYREVEAEWDAQIRKVLNAGIAISHMDGHQFIHLFPGLFPLCVKVAVRYQIPYIRASIFDLITLDIGYKRPFQWIWLRLWSKFFAIRRLPSHISSVPSIGFLRAGGRMDRDTILKALDRLKPKGSCSVVEVTLHPGTGDPHTSHKYTHWCYDWKNDEDLLLDKSLKEALDLRGIALTSFGEEI